MLPYVAVKPSLKRMPTIAERCPPLSPADGQAGQARRHPLCRVSAQLGVNAKVSSGRDDPLLAQAALDDG